MTPQSPTRASRKASCAGLAAMAASCARALFGLALVTDASDTTHNSALTGLSTIGGNFNFAYGETLSIGNDVSVLAGGNWTVAALA